MGQAAKWTPSRIARGIHRRVKIFANGLYSQFVNFYYGNTAGLASNFGAIREMERFRNECSTGSIDVALSAKQRAQHLGSYGYVTLGRVSPLTLVSSVFQEVQDAFRDTSRFAVSPSGVTLHLFDPEKISGVPALFDDTIMDAVSAYYGCAFRIHTVRLWRNLHVSGIDPDRSEVASNTFHHDNCKVTGLRVFVLLTDGVTRESGAFRFHDKLASQKIVRSFGYFHRYMQTRSAIKRLTNPETLRFFEGNAGDVAIVNTQQCLHAASIPKVGTYRDMLQFEVYPDRGPMKDRDTLFSTMPEDVEINRLKASQVSA